MAEVVGLTMSEMIIAANVGVMRRAKALSNGDQDRHGFYNDAPWENDVVSAQAEMAAAKYLNLYWCGAVMHSPRDVGDMIDARSVASEVKRLLIRPGDPDEVPFVSVLARGHEFEMRGWLFAQEGKVVEFLTDAGNGRPPAYFVDTPRLHPMNRLKQWVEGQRKLLKT